MAGDKPCVRRRPNRDPPSCSQGDSRSLLFMLVAAITTAYVIVMIIASMPVVVGFVLIFGALKYCACV